jgi:NAD(P)-dependent dehydrogenase (short-subunit alcohol dehydrogenase family)
MDLQLDGRAALITGSSKGIGEAIAKTLAREKATVVIHGRDR